MGNIESGIKKFIYFILLSTILIIIDQISKILVIQHFGIQYYGLGSVESIPIIGNFIQFQYIANEGMAFGLNFLPKFALALFSLIASIGLTIYLYRIRNYSIWVCLGIALILAGAVGNLIDRAFYDIFFSDGNFLSGKVIDFIKVDIPDITIFGKEYTHWPVFNVADSCVTVGVILLLIVFKKIPSFNDIFPKKKTNDEIASG